MFTIELSIESIEVTGLNALDLRRSLGLKDNSVVYIQPARYSDDFLRKDVEEGFARLYFDPTSRAERRYVTIHQLSAGDVVLDRNGYVVLNPDMTTERAKELWLAGKVE